MSNSKWLLCIIAGVTAYIHLGPGASAPAAANKATVAATEGVYVPTEVWGTESNYGDGKIHAVLRLTDGLVLRGDASVEIELVHITTSDADLPPFRQTVVIRAGARQASFEIPFVQDRIAEKRETFHLVLRNPVGVQIVNPVVAGGILD